MGARPGRHAAQLVVYADEPADYPPPRYAHRSAPCYSSGATRSGAGAESLGQTPSSRSSNSAPRGNRETGGWGKGEGEENAEPDQWAGERLQQDGAGAALKVGLPGGIERSPGSVVGLRAQESWVSFGQGDEASSIEQVGRMAQRAGRAGGQRLQQGAEAGHGVVVFLQRWQPVARPEDVIIVAALAPDVPESAQPFGAAAGEALLAIHNPGGVHLSLLLVALAGLIASLVMLRSRVFGKATATMGVVANSLVLSCFVALPLAPAIAFLFPASSAPFRIIWYVLIALKLFRLTRASE